MPDSNPKIVTVIVAAYRADRWVNECVQSILKQELPSGYKLQLIVGVDACQKTLKAVSQEKDPRLEIYMMSKNRGTYITFNTMMKYAKGNVICRFDADDIMYQDFLYKASILIEEGYSLIRYKLDVINQNNEITGSYPCGYGVITFSRYAWDTVGGYQPWRCAADSEMVRKIELTPGLKSYHLTDRAYVGYRSFPNSGSLTVAASTTFGSVERNEKVRHISKSEKVWKDGKNLSIKTVPLTGKCVVQL